MQGDMREFTLEIREHVEFLRENRTENTCSRMRIRSEALLDI